MTPNDTQTTVPPAVSTTPGATGTAAGTASAAPNVLEPPPLRSPRDHKLPLAVRKELLITRAALERYDCLHALEDVRGSMRNITRFRNWLPLATRPQSLWKVLGIAKDYPVLSSALSLGLPLLRRVPVVRWGWKLSKLGLVAGAGYWAWQTWQQVRSHSEAVPPAYRPVRSPGTADAAPKPASGFQDPLVH